MTTKELMEKRNALKPRFEELRAKAAKALEDPESPALTDEDRTNWEAINKDFDDLTRQIKQIQEVDAMATRVGAIDDLLEQPAGDPAVGRSNFNGQEAQRRNGGGAPTAEDRALAIQAWGRAGNPYMDLPGAHREACERVGFQPYRRGLILPLLDTESARRASRAFRYGPQASADERTLRGLEQRAMSAVTGAVGAFTIPTGFVNQFEINMLAFAGMEQVAEPLRTDTGAPLEWPTSDDTSNTGEQLGESASIGSSVEPVIGQIIFYAYKFHAKLVRIPTELLEDSAFNMVAYIGAALGERLARITNTRATTGTGAGTMRGIITAATLGVTTASATAIAFDELRELQHSVDPAYRNGAGFMFHDNILLALKLLKDGNGMYLWDVSTVDGQPDKLDGWPYTINQDMASAVTTTLKTVLFGQLSKYKIRRVKDVRLMRLDERYADNDEVAFDAFIRQDGNLIDAGTAPVKYIQQT